MGIVQKLLRGARKDHSPEPGAPADTRQLFKLLSKDYGLSMTSRGWAFEGNVVSEFQSQIVDAETALENLTGLKAHAMFTGVCVVGGNIVTMVANAKPKPYGITTSLTPSGVAELVSRLIEMSGGPVTEHRGCWMLRMP